MRRSVEIIEEEIKQYLAFEVDILTVSQADKGKIHQLKLIQQKIEKFEKDLDGRSSFYLDDLEESYKNIYDKYSKAFPSEIRKIFAEKAISKEGVPSQGLEGKKETIESKDSKIHESDPFIDLLEKMQDSLNDDSKQIIKSYGGRDHSSKLREIFIFLSNEQSGRYIKKHFERSNTLRVQRKTVHPGFPYSFEIHKTPTGFVLYVLLKNKGGLLDASGSFKHVKDCFKFENGQWDVWVNGTLDKNQSFSLRIEEKIASLVGEEYVVPLRIGAEYDGKISFFSAKGNGDLHSLVKKIPADMNFGDLFSIFLTSTMSLSVLNAKGLIHRDIKLPNILYYIKDGFYYAKLFDTGLAAKNGARFNSFSGTINNAPPELILGYRFQGQVGKDLNIHKILSSKSIDSFQGSLTPHVKDDVWSLADGLHELCSAFLKFRPGLPSRIKAEVASLKDLFWNEVLTKPRSERMSSEELVDNLRLRIPALKELGFDLSSLETRVEKYVKDMQSIKKDTVSETKVASVKALDAPADPEKIFYGVGGRPQASKYVENFNFLFKNKDMGVVHFQVFEQMPSIKSTQVIYCYTIPDAKASPKSARLLRVLDNWGKVLFENHPETGFAGIKSRSEAEKPGGELKKAELIVEKNKKPEEKEIDSKIESEMKLLLDAYSNNLDNIFRTNIDKPNGTQLIIDSFKEQTSLIKIEFLNNLIKINLPMEKLDENLARFQSKVDEILREKINQQNLRGSTLLHSAVRDELVNVVQQLLKFGAKASIENNDKYTPKDLAKQSESPAIRSLFESPLVKQSMFTAGKRSEVPGDNVTPRPSR